MKNPHAQALGKLGGKARSKKKTESSRINGRLGGRPKAVVELSNGFTE